MAAVSSLAFSALGQSTERKVTVHSTTRSLPSNFDGVRLRTNVFHHSLGVRVSNLTSRISIRCMSSVTGNALWFLIEFGCLKNVSSLTAMVELFCL